MLCYLAAHICGLANFWFYAALSHMFSFTAGDLCCFICCKSMLSFCIWKQPMLTGWKSMLL